MQVVGAIDQGTVNTKFTYFDTAFNVLVTRCVSHKQIYPQPGWLEHDPVELYSNTIDLMKSCTEELKAKYENPEIVCVGLVNQRETLVVWDKSTGQPLLNAIVWLDTRTHDLVRRLTTKYGSTEVFREKTGLPIASYFTGLKILWVLEKFPHFTEAIRSKRVALGTVDTWLVWNLTGGPNGGEYVTDITNASRTLLMDVQTASWSAELLRAFCPGLSKRCFAKIVANAEVVGKLTGTGIPELEGVPISGVAGDQQAACIGHGMFSAGETKATFGTGATLLMLTGYGSPIIARSGLLTTPCYQFTKKDPVMYGFEGSVAIAGAALTWLQDNFGALERPADAEDLLQTVSDTGGVYFVPAFAGLFAPRWREDARGCIVGLTQHSTRAHIVLALIQSIGFQLSEIFNALKVDASEIPDAVDNLGLVRVDGGMCSIVPSSLQVTADVTGKYVASTCAEVTSIGAGMLAAVGAGVITKEQMMRIKTEATIYVPQTTSKDRHAKFNRWEAAVERSLNWEEMVGPSDASGSRCYDDRLHSIDSTDVQLHPIRSGSMGSTSEESSDRENDIAGLKAADFAQAPPSG